MMPRLSVTRLLTTSGLCLALAACGSLGDEADGVLAREALYSRDLLARSQEAARQDQVDWFRAGPYVGVAGGWARSTAEAGDIDDALADRGYLTSTTLDEGHFGWKLYGGYRFEDPFAIELAAVDLGTIESDIDVSTMDIEAFLEDVADVHPFSAKGAAASGIWYPLDEERYRVGVKGGLWWWDGEVVARAATGEMVEVSDSGIDPLLGALATWEFAQDWSLRGEVEHYWVDEHEVTFFSLGVEWSPSPMRHRSTTGRGRDRDMPPASLREVR